MKPVAKSGRTRVRAQWVVKYTPPMPDTLDGDGWYDAAMRPVPLPPAPLYLVAVNSGMLRWKKVPGLDRLAVWGSLRNARRFVSEGQVLDLLARCGKPIDGESHITIEACYATYSPPSFLGSLGISSAFL